MRFRRRTRPQPPTLLRDDEIWELDSALAILIADALRRRAKGKSFPIRSTEAEWDTLIRVAAEDFDDYAKGLSNGDSPNVPAVGLAFLSEWWVDLWD